MKEIILSRHAEHRAIQRGTTKEEIEQCLQENSKLMCENNRFSRKKTFLFEAISPMNNRYYRFKTVEVISIEEADKIIVVTVKVYYSNEEEQK